MRRIQEQECTPRRSTDAGRDWCKTERASSQQLVLNITYCCRFLAETLQIVPVNVCHQLYLYPLDFGAMYSVTMCDHFKVSF